MANRHAHKKLRAEARARMAKTGVTYQHALHHVLARAQRPTSPPCTAVDLVAFARFGVPMTLATFEGPNVHGFVLLGRAPRSLGLHATFSVPSMQFVSPQGVN